MTKTILLTGISGFIGCHIMDHLLVNTDWNITGIASFRHKGISERITHGQHYQKNKNRVRVYTHDLTAPISNILMAEIGHVDYIINCASQSHVNRSIQEPVA